ncbi:AbiV family abortive infection protein [Micromonospora sp. CA-263727]|uniref:AbiV family abortive infection protein n=1 Tax=Micromonospora sp. CA-263727 TaxID=3239967 RepID=UPI003D8E82E9
MYARQLDKILHLPERQRFAVMAEGMEQLASSVAALEADAGALADSRRHQSAAVLRCFADEEAAKVLILLDVARAGWKDRKRVEDLLRRRFYQHLARGLYVRAYDGNPADLAEVRRYVDSWRTEFYLDGPMDVDWIFSNEVLAGREERLYVDYVRDEDGNGYWTGPGSRAAMIDEPFKYPLPASVAIRLVAAMHRIGLLSIDGLRTTRAVWQGVAVDDSMHWSTLHPLNVAVIGRLAEEGLDLDIEENLEAVRFVCDRWIFPLYTLDLDMEKVTLAELQAARERRLAWESGVTEDLAYYYGQ